MVAEVDKGLTVQIAVETGDTSSAVYKCRSVVEVESVDDANHCESATDGRGCMGDSSTVSNTESLETEAAVGGAKESELD